MTKTKFDSLCETIMSGTQPTPAKPISAAGTPQTTPPAQPNQPNQPNQINDDELFKALQQKMNDQKFKDALLKMLNPQQNAGNQPA
jgi:hypothetical protein